MSPEQQCVPQQRQRRWAVTDFAQAYAAGAATPSQVAENVLRAVRDSEAGGVPMRYLIACDAADVRAQDAASAHRRVLQRCSASDPQRQRSVHGRAASLVSYVHAWGA